MAIPLLVPTRSRPATANDLPAIVAFYEYCERFDPLDRAPSLANLQYRLDHPPPGGTHHRHLWETPAGELVGIVALWIEDPTDEVEVRMAIRVHPHHRHGILADEMVAWAEQQALEKAVVTHRPARILTAVHDDRPYYPNLYEHQGYTPIRWFYEMHRPLSDPIPPAQLPLGFASRPTHPDEAAAWVDLFNNTFVDHWHFQPMTLADYQYRLQQPTHQPELDWVAVAADGTLASFCTVRITTHDYAIPRPEGWIAMLGTRRGYRRLGLARALLLQGLHQLQSHDLASARIGVDSQNPNQAQSLYESVGFQVKHTTITYEKVL